MRIHVQVQSDYLERMSHVSKPLLALAELIWNGFDADAIKVEVKLNYNKLDGLEQISVSDNGHGIMYEDAVPAFQNLGGSWKKNEAKSKTEGRILHGKAGKGRFRAFSLGSFVEWNTCYLEEGVLYEYIISGSLEELGTFEIGDRRKSNRGATGTTVTISAPRKDFRSLRSESTPQDITSLFAMYMRQYPQIKLLYDGNNIDPASVELHSEDYKLSEIRIQEGRMIEVDLSVIEWRIPTERCVFLCDAEGFSLEKTNPGVQAPGFNFTAYLKSCFLKELDESNSLILDDLHPDLKAILDAGKIKLKEHFRRRAARLAVNRVEEWKKENIYPYKEEARNILEETERQVFDVCALSLSDYLPDFEDSDNKNKQLALCFLKQAIENSPSSVQQILQDVLDLPKEKQEELSSLLQKTSLSAIINAAKEVADRLDFIKGLEALIFEDDLKDEVLERKHLHRILAEHTWVFGEEFNLSNDDESLTTVLKKHLKMLGEDHVDIEPVRREDGSGAIIDLMLGRVIPQPHQDEQEYLVVELKRPNKTIDTTITSQIESYALAVAGDKRFRDTKSKWVFWAISSDMNSTVRKKVNQRGRSEGILYEDSDQKIVVWVKTWSQVIQECRGRLKFYQERLEYCATHDAGLAYLKKTHRKYLPEVLSEEVVQV